MIDLRINIFQQSCDKEQKRDVFIQRERCDEMDFVNKASTDWSITSSWKPDSCGEKVTLVPDKFKLGRFEAAEIYSSVIDAHLSKVGISSHQLNILSTFTADESRRIRIALDVGFAPNEAALGSLGVLHQLPNPKLKTGFAA